MYLKKKSEAADYNSALRTKLGGINIYDQDMCKVKSSIYFPSIKLNSKALEMKYF